MNEGRLGWRANMFISDRKLVQPRRSRLAGQAPSAVTAKCPSCFRRAALDFGFVAF